MNDPNNYWASSPSPAPVEFPKTLYHATEPPKRVLSQAEVDALGEEWKTEYVHREFPKMKFRPKPDGDPPYEFKVVESPEDESKLGMGWSDTPPEPEPPTTPL